MSSLPSIGISALAYRLPARRVGLAELGRAGRLESSPAMLRGLGFRSCYVHDERDGFDELVLDAGREVLRTAAVDPGEIGGLFLYRGLGAWTPGRRPGSAHGVLPLFRYPVARLAAELGCPHARALTLSEQGCSGLFSAIELAWAQLQTSSPDAILCLAADRLPAGGQREVTFNLMSDGAGALLLQRGAERNRVLSVHQLSEAGYWDTPRYQHELIAAYFPMAERAITGALERAGLRLADIRWFVPANVSHRSWTILADLLGLPLDRVFTDNITRVGHTVSCDLIINLADMERRGLLRPGDRLLAFTFGFGASWSTLILEH